MTLTHDLTKRGAVFVVWMTGICLVVPSVGYGQTDAAPPEMEAAVAETIEAEARWLVCTNHTGLP